jgi:hypothetical protein
MNYFLTLGLASMGLALATVFGAAPVRHYGRRIRRADFGPG